MVFSGKPSTGCQMCRTRRIKCDEAKPACNQCVRTGRTCPGYKSKIDLLFRNETGATAAERRARTAARKKAGAPRRGGGRPGQQEQKQPQPKPQPQPQGQLQPQLTQPGLPSGPNLAQALPTRPASSSGSSSRSAAAGGRISQSPDVTYNSYSSYGGNYSGSSPSSYASNNFRGSSHGNSPSSYGAGSVPGQQVVRHGYPRQPPHGYVYGDPYNETSYYDEGQADDGSTGGHVARYGYGYGSGSGYSSGYGSGYGHGYGHDNVYGYDTQESILPALPIPPEDLAVCHFFSNFVLVPYQGTGRGYMDFLEPMMRSIGIGQASAFAPVAATSSNLMLEPANISSGGTTTTSIIPLKLASPRAEADTALLLAFRSCALAYMSTRVSSNSYAFADKALAAYTRALAATHVAIKDPDMSRSDSTLGAVLLLSMFETITAKKMGMFAWGSHIEGAISLVKARAKDQRKSRVGLSLFIAVRAQMIIHCLLAGKPPDMDHDWWLENAVSDPTGAAAQRLGIRTAELRARIVEYMAISYDRSPESVARVMSLAQQAYELDRECVAWANGVPAEWRPRTAAWQENLPDGTDYSEAAVFPGRVDRYPDMYIVSVWNTIRITRLTLSSIIVRCAAWACAPTDYRTTSQYAAATRTCSEIITDIIASVPFYLGLPQQQQEYYGSNSYPTMYGSFSPLQGATGIGASVDPWYVPASPTPSPSASTSSSPPPPPPTASLGFMCGEETGLKGLAGFFLAWPLSIVHSQDYATDNQRAWSLGRMRYINNSIGVRYAGVMAEFKIRVPSMLIYRDRLTTQRLRLEATQAAQSAAGAASAGTPSPASSNASMSPGTAPGSSASTISSPGRPLDPLQQWEQSQKQVLEADVNNLLTKASGSSGAYGKWVTSKMMNI